MDPPTGAASELVTRPPSCRCRSRPFQTFLEHDTDFPLATPPTVPPTPKTEGEAPGADWPLTCHPSRRSTAAFPLRSCVWPWLELDACDGVNFPDDRHMGVQGRRARASPMGVTDVEERRPLDKYRNWGIVEIVAGARRLVAEEALEGVPGRLQLREARVVRRRKPRDFHCHINLFPRLEAVSHDQVKVVVILPACGVKEGRQPYVPLLLRHAF